MVLPRSFLVSSSVDPVDWTCSCSISWSSCTHGYLAIDKLYLHYPHIKGTYSSSLGYFLLGLISSFVFRAIRDALPNNPAAQERILGASFLALAIADVSHSLTSNYRTISQFAFQQLTQYVFYCLYDYVGPSPYLSTSVSLLPSWASRQISSIHLPIGTAWPTATSPLLLSSSSSGAYPFSLNSPVWHSIIFSGQHGSWVLAGHAITTANLPQASLISPLKPFTVLSIAYVCLYCRPFIPCRLLVIQKIRLSNDDGKS